MASWWLYRLRWWLVDHPAIAGFEWRPNETPGASVPFVAGIVLSYLSLTLLLHRGLLPLPSPSAAALRLASSAHNLLLFLVSAAMAVGCALSALAQAPSPRWIFCFPPSSSTRAGAGPVFFWAHIFYFSKIYELLDTLLILLAGGRRLTFLHVYHHAGVIVMCYIWLAAAQSLVPVALVTNAGVHVVMYAYYLSSSAGWRWRPRWKRAVTELQIAQFVFSFAVSVVFLWYHFAGGGCSGMNGWLFNAVFNASLLALFLDFHNTSYTAGGKKGGKRKEDKGE
ncbi:elongation of fatty acids protein 3-like [Phoenix dactylifera]|uniref:very-long-chain 3-oxoacyl-CoA synthase n=1 Tax=Phoenix dactylifera TaxID=42345 RepID=A0A8B7CLZ7_PHODC|nr:elongation of fatty acids protein 3-like [Phoenix dactylifera]